MDKKAVFLPCRFGASSPQAIGVTGKQQTFRSKSPISPMAFRTKYKTFYVLVKNILYIYFIFILKTTYNFNESRPSKVILLSTVFNGTLFIINLVILNTNAPLS